MATNDYEEETPTQQEQLARIFGTTVAKVTDTGPSTIPLRMFVLCIVVMVCVALAPSPANIVGIIATLALAISIRGAGGKR